MNYFESIDKNDILLHIKKYSIAIVKMKYDKVARKFNMIKWVLYSYMKFMIIFIINNKKNNME